MELQFQQQQCGRDEMPAAGKAAGRGRSSRCRFVGVRQRPSGRWVAEIKDTAHKIRVWLGTFETAEEAARAYDEAACLLRGSNTRTNFAAAAANQHAASSSPPDSPLASRIRTLLTHKRHSKSAGSPPPPPSQQPAIAFCPALPTTYRRQSTTATNLTGSSTSSSISFATSPAGARHALIPSQRATDEVYSYRAYQLTNHGGQELHHMDQPWSTASSTLPPPLAGSHDTPSNANANTNTNADDNPNYPTIADTPPKTETAQKDSAFEFDDGGDDPCDSLWDLPPICQLSCRSLMY